MVVVNPSIKDVETTFKIIAGSNVFVENEQ
jgi:hypothetical protein